MRTFVTVCAFIGSIIGKFTNEFSNKELVILLLLEAILLNVWDIVENIDNNQPAR